MKFSIIVPIYNVEKYLNKCVDSLLNQTFKDFELILVDDGSPDNCPSICDDYAERDSRVRVIHKKNGGLVSARNAGLLSAKGEYVFHIDGDDWVSIELLEKANNILTKHNDLDMICYSGVKQYENHSEKLPFDIEEGFYTKKDLVEKIYPYMMYDDRKPFCKGLIFPVAWNKVYKRKLLLEHYCKEEKIRMGEDNAFVFECLYFSNQVYFLNEELYYYNQLNVGSITSNYDKNRFYNNNLLNNYMENRFNVNDQVIINQLNAFKAYWIIMAIFHEAKCKRKFMVSRKHIKNELKKYRTQYKVRLVGLPLTAKLFMILLKLRLYSLTIIGAKILSKRR